MANRISSSDYLRLTKANKLAKRYFREGRVVVMYRVASNRTTGCEYQVDHWEWEPPARGAR